MCLTIDELRGLCTPDNIYLTLHASKRLEQRGILIDDVISCIMTGEIIEEYPNDYPYYPSSDKWESDLKTRKEN